MQPKYYGAAANYNQSGGSPFNRKLLLIGVLALGLIVLAIAVTTVLSIITSAPRREMAQLVARENKLQDLIESNKERIKNGDLSRVNATANLLLLSDGADLTAQMQSAYGLAAVPADVAALESTKTLETELDEAERVGKFDRDFAAAVRDKLAASLQLAQKVAGSASSQKLKTVLAQNVRTLKTIDDQLAALKL